MLESVRESDFKRIPSDFPTAFIYCNITVILIDPLASSKGFWADLLGVGDFYYELSILIVQICIQTRSSNGGLISIPVLHKKVKSLKHSKRNVAAVSVEDVYRSIEKLTVLGSGYKIIKFDGKDGYLLSVPTEFNKDHEELMSVAQLEGYVSSDNIMTRLHWRLERFQVTINNLLKDGIVWIDQYSGKIDNLRNANNN